MCIGLGLDLDYAGENEEMRFFLIQTQFLDLHDPFATLSNLKQFAPIVL